MCRDCWREAGEPSYLPSNTDEILALIGELYEQEDCSAGGPLHAELDDWNLEGHLQPWEPDTFEARTSELAWKICEALNPLPVAQRQAVLAKYEGFTAYQRITE